MQRVRPCDSDPTVSMGEARSDSLSKARNSGRDIPFLQYRVSDRVMWVVAIASRLLETSMLLENRPWCESSLTEGGFSGADPSLKRPVRAWRLRRCCSVKYDPDVKLKASRNLQFSKSYNSHDFSMSSTGGGWAQLRQQARSLETQVCSFTFENCSMLDPKGTFHRPTG